MRAVATITVATCRRGKRTRMQRGETVYTLYSSFLQFPHQHAAYASTAGGRRQHVKDEPPSTVPSSMLIDVEGIRQLFRSRPLLSV